MLKNMIFDMLTNKKHNPIETELFIRSSKIAISFVFINKHILQQKQNIRLNYTLTQHITLL